MGRLVTILAGIENWIARHGWTLVKFFFAATFATLVAIGIRDAKRAPRWDERPPWNAAYILTVSPWSKVAFFDSSGVRCAVLLDRRGEPVSISCVPSMVTEKEAR